MSLCPFLALYIHDLYAIQLHAATGYSEVCGIEQESRENQRSL